MTATKGFGCSNGLAEARRNLEELTNAYRKVEEENVRLRKENERLRAEQKTVSGPGASEVTAVVAAPAPGRFVDFIDRQGIVHSAHVLELLSAGVLRIKISRTAQPDLVIEAKPLDKQRRVDGWRPHEVAAVGSRAR